MANSNDVRKGIQQAKAGEIGLGVIAIETIGVSYYAGHVTESTGLGLLAFIVLLIVFFSAARHEEFSAWFSWLLGLLAAGVFFTLSYLEGENGILTTVIISLLIGAVTVGGNFAGMQHIRDLGDQSPEKQKGE